MIIIIVKGAQLTLLVRRRSRGGYVSNTKQTAFRSSVVIPTMLPKEDQKWTEKYLRAALEVNGRNMALRIIAAREAVAERKKDLKGDSDHHAERYEIEAALKVLESLEAETREWPVLG